MKFPLVANCKLVPTSKLVNSSLVLAQTEFLEALKQVHEAASEVTASVRGSVSKRCRKVPSFPHLESRSWTAAQHKFKTGSITSMGIRFRDQTSLLVFSRRRTEFQR